MRKPLFILGLIGSLWPSLLPAQLHCTPENRLRLQRQLQHLGQAQVSHELPGAYMEQVGRGFLGLPYVGKTLEIEGEPLVVNLGELDCTTFLENAIVLSRLLCLDRLSEEAFYEQLELLRYRSGERNGYASRLHYFTEWMLDNERKGILRQVSQELGGSEWRRDITFMSGHSHLYPFLQGEATLAAIREAERTLSATTFHYLPKNKIQALEGGIQDGDLIAITTSVGGLDIAHVGFAIRVQGRVHLFHASSTLKQVVISDVPLADYLAGIKSNTGVMVCRLAQP